MLSCRPHSEDRLCVYLYFVINSYWMDLFLQHIIPEEQEQPNELLAATYSITHSRIVNSRPLSKKSILLRLRVPFF